MISEEVLQRLPEIVLYNILYESKDHELEKMIEIILEEREKRGGKIKEEPYFAKIW